MLVAYYFLIEEKMLLVEILNIIFSALTLSLIVTLLLFSCFLLHQFSEI